MGSALRNFDAVVFQPMDQPVEIIYPTAPMPLPVMFQGVGLAESMAPVAVDVFYKLVDALESLFVLPPPMQITIPGAVGSDLIAADLDQLMFRAPAVFELIHGFP
jgi:hypothetical protein